VNLKSVASITTGHRRAYGTDWPIETAVYRAGPRRWVVAFNLCNGVPSGTRVCRTRREALEIAGIEGGTA